MSTLKESQRILIVVNGKPPGRTRTGTEALSVAEEVFRVDGVAVRVLRTEVTDPSSFCLGSHCGENSYEL